ncbi:MAG: hypothetical protein OXT65_00435 [Alphaproteobacteria bacterium]|nr:hypothetical protein [Alphaproteobacteria bacterium]
MSLRYAVEGAVTAQRMRKRMKRTGKTPRGHWLWTKEEDRKVIRLYPDYKAMKKQLRRRTLISLKRRASNLGIARKRHVWTGAEITLLRRLFPETPRHEILAAFPYLTWRQIYSRARYAGFRRKKKPFKMTGHQPLDDILRFAYRNNLSLADIDKLSRTKKYFQKAQWCSNGFRGHKAILRAALALGGRVRVEWEDD